MCTYWIVKYLGSCWTCQQVEGTCPYCIHIVYPELKNPIYVCTAGRIHIQSETRVPARKEEGVSTFTYFLYFLIFMSPHTKKKNTMEWRRRPKMVGQPVALLTQSPTSPLTSKNVCGCATIKNNTADNTEMRNFSRARPPPHPHPHSLKLKGPKSIDLDKSTEPASFLHPHVICIYNDFKKKNRYKGDNLLYNRTKANGNERSAFQRV